MRLVGEDLLTAEDEPVELTEVHKRVIDAICAAADKVAPEPADKQRVLRQISETVEQAIQSLQTGAGAKVPAQDAGELVIDIGLGFGFDLIDGRVEADRANIPGRQARMLWSERALERFIATAGKDGRLTDIYRVFVGLADPPVI